MGERHSLLARQLKRHLGADTPIPEEWADFIRAVDEAYHQSDIDRGMLERALDLSSEELLEANSELRAVVQAFPDLFLRLDLEGRILECKVGNGTELVLPIERLVGKKVQSIPDFGTASRFQRAIEEVRASRSIVSVEYSLNFEDRSEWYEARVLPLREDQLLAIVRNISDRKVAESALRLSEQEYRGLFETAHDAIILVTPSTQRVLRVNKRACHLYGYSESEFVGHPLPSLVGDTVFYTEGGSRGIEQGSFETIHARSDGTKMLMEIHTSIVQYRGQKAILSINRDVTAREEAKNELQSSLSLLQATLDSTADGILVVDTDGQAVALNRRFSEMWEIPERLLDSRSDAEMLAFVLDQLSDPEAFMAKVNELYSRPDAESHDVVEFKDGRIFERYSRPRLLGDSYAGRVWSFRNITQRGSEAQVLCKAREGALHDELAALSRSTCLSEQPEQT